MSAIGIPQFRHFSRSDLVVFSRPRLTFFARTSNYTKLLSARSSRIATTILENRRFAPVAR
jgi:hypothetical protein